MDTDSIQLLKFRPILKSVVWGGEKIAPFKGIVTDQTRIGESWDDIEFINCDEDGKLVVNIEPSVSVGIYYR